MAISIKFPFNESFDGGIFSSNKTTSDKVRTNLMSLLTTKRRQRPMSNNFYSPLYDVIFEPWDEITEEKTKTALEDKIAFYIPEATVQDITFSFDEYTLVLGTKITYSLIEMAGATDSVEIDVATQSPVL